MLVSLELQLPLITTGVTKASYRLKRGVFITDSQSSFDLLNVAPFFSCSLHAGVFLDRVSRKQPDGRQRGGGRARLHKPPGYQPTCWDSDVVLLFGSASAGEVGTLPLESVNSSDRLVLAAFSHFVTRNLRGDDNTHTHTHKITRFQNVFTAFDPNEELAHGTLCSSNQTPPLMLTQETQSRSNLNQAFPP